MENEIRPEANLMVESGNGRYEAATSPVGESSSHQVQVDSS